MVQCALWAKCFSFEQAESIAGIPLFPLGFETNALPVKDLDKLQKPLENTRSWGLEEIVVMHFLHVILILDFRHGAELYFEEINKCLRATKNNLFCFVIPYPEQRTQNVYRNKFYRDGL